MITDPDHSGYRYPQPGERLWHRPTAHWVTIIGEPGYGPLADEVDAQVDGLGDKVTVKLRSLSRGRPDGDDQAALDRAAADQAHRDDLARDVARLVAGDERGTALHALWPELHGALVKLTAAYGAES